MTRLRLCSAVLIVSAASAGCGDPGESGRPGTAPPPVGAGRADAEAVESASAREAAVAAHGARAAGRVPEGAPICDTITNSFRCAREVEYSRLPEASLASRRGDTLFLELRTGATIRLVDFTGTPADVIHYSYHDHWPEAGYFVVHKQYYEGSQYVLVEDSAGRETVVADRPIPAPGGARFAVLSLDLVAGYGPNVLQIWTLAGGAPRREWETAPTQWGPMRGRWLDEATLRFTQHGYCGELGGVGRGMCDRFATLRRISGDWRLEVGHPEDAG